MQVFQALRCASLEILTKHTLNMKRNIISCASALFFLAVFSCERDKPDPECKDASCCGPTYNQYVESIKDVSVHLIGSPNGSSGALRAAIAYPSDPKNPYRSRYLQVCPNSRGKVKGFSPDAEFKDTIATEYIYRVSGKVFTDVVNPRLTADPVLSIYIDTFEKIH